MLFHPSQKVSHVFPILSFQQEFDFKRYGTSVLFRTTNDEVIISVTFRAVKFYVHFTIFMSTVLILTEYWRLPISRKMTGSFRITVWDPPLIFSQIVSFQCIMYVSLGLWICVLLHLIGGHPISIDYIFKYQVMPWI